MPTTPRFTSRIVHGLMQNRDRPPQGSESVVAIAQPRQPTDSRNPAESLSTRGVPGRYAGHRPSLSNGGRSSARPRMTSRSRSLSWLVAAVVSTCPAPSRGQDVPLYRDPSPTEGPRIEGPLLPPRLRGLPDAAAAAQRPRPVPALQSRPLAGPPSRRPRSPSSASRPCRPRSPRCRCRRCRAARTSRSSGRPRSARPTGRSADATSGSTPPSSGLTRHGPRRRPRSGAIFTWLPLLQRSCPEGRPLPSTLQRGRAWPDLADFRTIAEPRPRRPPGDHQHDDPARRQQGTRHGEGQGGPRHLPPRVSQGSTHRAPIGKPAILAQAGRPNFAQATASGAISKASNAAEAIATVANPTRLAISLSSRRRRPADARSRPPAGFPERDPVWGFEVGVTRRSAVPGPIPG